MFLIEQENNSIKIAIYHLRSRPIIDALIHTKTSKPHIPIEIIINKYCHDTSPDKENMQELAKYGIVIYPLGARQWDMHEKFIVFGQNTVTQHLLLWQGSYNLTGEQTRDNIVLINNPAIIETFNNRFEHLKEACLKNWSVQPMPAAQAIPTVIFSPRGGARQKLIDFIDQEEQSIQMAMHTFYHPEIWAALCRASSRNVQVSLIVNSTQFNDGRPGNKAPIDREVIETFLRSGIKLYKYAGPGIMHHKFFIFGRNAAKQGQRFLWTGTYNATERAEDKNCEDIVIFDEPAVIDAFMREFNDMKGHALMVPSQAPPSPKRPVPDNPSQPSDEPAAKKK